MMEYLASFRVAIKGDDVELPTFEAPHQAPTEMVKYVQAEPNAHFEIELSVLPFFDFASANSISFDIHMDGKYLMGRTAPKSVCCKGVMVTDVVKGLKSQDVGGTWHLHPFKFGDLKVVSDNSRLRHEDIDNEYGKLGSIEIVVSRYNRRGPAVLMPTWQRLGTGGDDVPENGVKKTAASMVARLAAPVVSDASPTHNGMLVGKPLARYFFLYRTKEALQMLAIIPREPSPVPIEHRPVEELSLTELQELVKRQRDQEAATEKVKQEERDERAAVARKARREATLRKMTEGSITSMFKATRPHDEAGDVAFVEVAGMKRKREVIEISDSE